MGLPKGSPSPACAQEVQRAHAVACLCQSLYGGGSGSRRKEVVRFRGPLRLSRDRNFNRCFSLTATSSSASVLFDRSTGSTSDIGLVGEAIATERQSEI